MWKSISKLTNKSSLASVILSTHSMEEAEALSDRIGIIANKGLFKSVGSR